MLPLNTCPREDETIAFANFWATLIVFRPQLDGQRGTNAVGQFVFVDAFVCLHVSNIRNFVFNFRRLTLSCGEPARPRSIVGTKPIPCGKASC
jgi:hypothetical protein